MLCFIPLIVYAQTCDNKISIKSISKENSTGYIEEINNPITDNTNLTTNLKVYNVGDSITYNITIKNNSNEDYVLNKNLSNSSNITYELISDNNSIKANSEKEIKLKITYKNKVDDSLFKSNNYFENKEINIILGDNIINPNTSNRIIIIITLILLLLLLLISYLLIKKDIKSSSLFLLFIPVIVNASCQYRLNINSNIEIRKVLPNPCTYEGELVQGAEYINGQYIYRYMQEWNYDDSINSFNWVSINNAGWGVRLANLDSTDSVNTTLCSSINNKSIVSMSGMFSSIKTETLDLSNFDTRNVQKMEFMFGNAKVKTLDLSGFIISDNTRVKNMMCF